MSNNRTKIIAGLLGVLGAVVAFFGVRIFIRWMQQRAHNQQYQARMRRRMQGQPTQPLEEGMPVEGTRYQPQSQPDKQPIPATGAPVEEIEVLAFEIGESEQQPIAVDDMVGRLAQYLLIFHHMIGLLRSRRTESGAEENAHSLTPSDRGSLQVTLDQMEEQTPDDGEGNLEEGSLQERIYKLTAKIRDALQNSSYDDADLFRINGEVRSEACQLVDEIQTMGAGSGVDMQQVRQEYECA